MVIIFTQNKTIIRYPYCKIEKVSSMCIYVMREDSGCVPYWITSVDEKHICGSTKSLNSHRHILKAAHYRRQHCPRPIICHVRWIMEIAKESLCTATITAPMWLMGILKVNAFLEKKELLRINVRSYLTLTQNEVLQCYIFFRIIWYWWNECYWKRFCEHITNGSQQKQSAG